MGKKKEKNWERRTLVGYGSKFRMDVNNPEKTEGGSDLYNIQSVTDEGKVTVLGQQENGTFRIHSDGTLELIGGQKKDQNGVDVIIAGKNGDVIINADKNGKVRIRGKAITIQADEDLDLIGGRNVNIKSGSGRILLTGNTIDEKALQGSGIPGPLQWASLVFKGTGLPAAGFAGLLSSVPFIGPAAAAIASGDFDIGSAIGGIVGGVLPGPLGSIASGAISGFASGGLGGALSGALGSASGLGGTLGTVASAISGGFSGNGGFSIGGALGAVSGQLGGALSSAVGGGALGNALGGALSSGLDGSGFNVGGALGSLADSAGGFIDSALDDALGDSIGGRAINSALSGGFSALAGGGNFNSALTSGLNSGLNSLAGSL